MGNLFVKILIVEYAIATIFYCADGNYAKALYWIGAMIISTSVLWMK